jgi:hypothetical protein
LISTCGIFAAGTAAGKSLPPFCGLTPESGDQTTSGLIGVGTFTAFEIAFIN